ncbi:MAG: tRNA 4-thiouridine(8) synthase ThiI [Gammaproteobacteria bacterium]|jgi:tRNA uracil 4-sulfurtransferase|nr:tRNA 4-thiouridine(8) synthase ThiI [Gammaproteobacteria bacterium]
MKYLLKYSPEITIKSRPVRARFVKQLSRNLTTLLKKIDEGIKVISKRDYLEVNIPIEAEESRRLIESVLTSTPGVATIASTNHMLLENLEDVLTHALSMFTERLNGKTFAVRCKRAGKHTFTSVEVEKFIGAGLNVQTQALGVNLSKPDITVRLEIREQDVFIVDELMKGLGGFPLGTQDGVLSLISGGFDSAVSSYLSNKRGLLTHYCFFNLGGHEHEIAVKEVALYLWMRYGSSHRVKFISVPFEAVVGEIISKVDNSQMGVVLKRMMLRVGSRLAADFNLDALVTGEAVAQVSSQTLTNLAVIDDISETLVLRPLIMSEKQDIIDLAKKIGTEKFSAVIPEYCGVISVKPTTKARLHRIEREEDRFDFSILEAAIEATKYSNIDQLIDEEKKAPIELREVDSVPEQTIVIDIRHPSEEELSPLKTPGDEIKKIPFFKLNTAFEGDEILKDTQYFLYCDKGIMSRLHASYLVDKGYSNVGVYRPS